MHGNAFKLWVHIFISKYKRTSIWTLLKCWPHMLPQICWMENVGICTSLRIVFLVTLRSLMASEHMCSPDMATAVEFPPHTAEHEVRSGQFLGNIIVAYCSTNVFIHASEYHYLQSCVTIIAPLPVALLVAQWYWVLNSPSFCSQLCCQSGLGRLGSPCQILNLFCADLDVCHCSVKWSNQTDAIYLKGTFLKENNPTTSQTWHPI